jgi:predicted metal-dependent TIM-barrel fold hydrolase
VGRASSAPQNTHVAVLLVCIAWHHRSIPPPVPPAPRLFDAHLHPEVLPDVDLETLRHFGVRRALVVGRVLEEPSSDALRTQIGALVAEQIPRLQRCGIEATVALGVHPRSLPRRGLQAVLDVLPAAFDHRRVAALGEIGLHQGGPAEEEAVVEQLHLARRLRVPVLVHTPERDKERHTRRLLTLLRAHGPAPERVLVDHVSARTLPLVLGCGHWAGLTIQLGALRAERAVALVGRVGSERLVLNSDAGDRPGDLLSLPRAASLLERAGLSDRVVRRVLWSNAATFLGLGELRG